MTTECDLEENFISTGKNNGKNIFGFTALIVFGGLDMWSEANEKLRYFHFLTNIVLGVLFMLLKFSWEATGLV